VCLDRREQRSEVGSIRDKLGDAVELATAVFAGDFSAILMRSKDRLYKFVQMLFVHDFTPLFCDHSQQP
jgi:hypothetical protein